MMLEEKVHVTVERKEKTRFVWLDGGSLSLITVITNPKCGTISGKAAFQYNFYARFNNIDFEWYGNCLEPTSSLETHITLEPSNPLFPKIGDIITIRTEEYNTEEKTTTQLGETKLTVPQKTIQTLEATFKVPNHTNVEIKSDDGLIQLYYAPYTCTLSRGEDYLFHIRSEGSLRRLADIRLHTTDTYAIECLELDGDSIWCGRQEAPGITVSQDNIITIYIGAGKQTKDDVLATLRERGFIPFTQHPPYSSAGGGWVRSEGIQEVSYKDEWGDTTFEMWVSGESSNPPESTNDISWRYKDKTSERECKKGDPPATGACILRPPATALLDTAIDTLYYGMPETITARLVDTIPSEGISVDVGAPFECAIEVINWSWVTGKIRARIEATGKGVEPWERAEEATLSSAKSTAFNDVLFMPAVKYQLDFFAEHYDDSSKSWVIDDMKRVTVATKTTAMLLIHDAVDSNGIPFKSQEDISILWDGKNCGLHPPAELIVGQGYYCDKAKLVETSLGQHIITVRKEGFTTARKELKFVAGTTHEFIPTLTKEGEVPPEVDMMSISEFYAMIAAKDAPINTFGDEATGEGICACTGSGSQEQRIWCKNPGTTEVLEPMATPTPPPVSGLGDEHPEKPTSFKSGCGEYPTPDSTMEYIKEWWSIAIELAFMKFEIYVGSYIESTTFIPAVMKQIQDYDEVVVSILEDDDYDTPYPRRVFFPLEPALEGGSTRVGDNKIEVVLLTKGPGGHFGPEQTRIGPFRYLEEDWSIGRPPALLYRDWDIDGTGLGGAVELEYWEDSNPPKIGDISFTKFGPEYTTTELPRAMLEQALNILPFMTEETYAKLMLNQAVDASTDETLSSVKVWWDDCYCGGYGSDWEELIGPGKTLGGKDCKVDFGTHTIILKKDDYADFSTTIEFKPGITYSVAPRLIYTGEEDEEPSTDAYLIINSAKNESGWSMLAEIWLGKAGAKAKDTGNFASTLKPTPIRFCNGCEFGRVKTGIGSKSNPIIYTMVLKKSGYANAHETFKAYPGNVLTKDYTLKNATYDAASTAHPSENPKNLYTDTEDNIIIRVVNTGDTDTDCTVLVIFKGVETEKEYVYTSGDIHIPEGEEAVATVPVIIPTDAIPEGQNIANYDIKTQVLM